MKIGRNSPCICGSGKKYKNCCLLLTNRTAYNVSKNMFPENVISDFDYVKINANKLYERLGKYKYSDLVKAIFCINLWRRNRSALTQLLTLNYVLTMDKSFGNKDINGYNDLENLYSEISDLLAISMADYIIDDYGEVFINHCGRSFPVITGTGHQQVYGAIRYMQTLASLRNKEDELTSLLEYVELIINYTKETNEPNSDAIITFELPSQNFWESIKELFNNDSFKIKYSEAAKIMGYQTGPIELRHFVKKDEIYFPLCKLSILVDYYKYLLSDSTDDEKERHIKNTLFSVLDTSYNFETNAPNRVLLEPWIVENPLNKPTVKRGVLFTATAEQQLVVVLDKNYYKTINDIKKVKKQINSIKEKDQLRIIEPFHRKGAEGSYGISASKDVNIVYILMEPFTDITSHGMWLEECCEECFKCTALDLLYIIGFADDFKEISEYILFDSEDEAKVMSFGGKFNHFATWKNFNHMISSGAIEHNYVSVDYNKTEDYVLSHFTKTLSQFPRNDTALFCDPFNWKTGKSYLDYLNLSHKGCIGFGGDVIRLNSDVNLFLAHNVEFFSKSDFDESAHTLIKVIDELNQKLFLRYSKYIEKIPLAKGKTIQFLYMPWSYANVHYIKDFISDPTRSIVFGNERVDDSIIIRYSVNPSTLMDGLQNAKDRTIENTYFKELIYPLRKYAPDIFDKLDEQLEKDKSLKKTVSAFTVEREYYFSEMAIDTDISEISFTRAKKEIATICMQSGVAPGEYIGEDATQIIRRMQLSLVKRFEEIISQYDKFNLHKKVLNYLAIQNNGVYINYKRYNAFKDLDDEVLQIFENDTRELREKYRRNEDTATYLLESNLWVKHEENPIICSKDDFNFLLAFSDWLVVLQEDSDLCHHGDNTYSIIVDDEYIVNIVSNKEVEKRISDLLRRKYSSKDYHIENDEKDADFLKKAAKAFEEDTGVELGMFLSLMEYMELDIAVSGVATEIYPNVFEIQQDILKSSFIEVLEDKPSDDKKVDAAIEFLKLIPEKLKTTKGINHNFLPTWERENRDNRINNKPIIMRENICIFSPANINYVKTRWKNGILDWYLPFEIGLPKLKKVIVSWKKRYENKMVTAIAQKFKENGFDIVETDLDFFRRFPKDRYPEELGDYDIIAINKSKQELWYIESKVLQKVGSVYEMYMQQKSFFKQHKEDEKFQRRIDYMNQNLSKMLKSLGVDLDNLKIVPYMVTNKIFMSRYKDINFDIISFSELVDLLEV